MPSDPMCVPIRPGLLAGVAAACLLVVCQSGCTSALTTASLTNGLWEGSEHAAEAEPAPDAQQPAPPEAEPTDTAEDAAADRERREAALEEAMSRLSRLGPIDPAVEAALVATLQRTQPEDWPVVVDEFAASLPAAPPESPETATATVEAPSPEPSQLAEQEPPTEPTEPPVVATDHPPTAPPAVDSTLAVRSACFASAVRAWGDVDRFTADCFEPGQEVIVYVELDNLAVGASPSGHTTCVDAVLRLVDEADHTLHTWTFEPIAETCTGRRRDYFARYVVRIPDTAPPGGCRVEMSITDTLAGATAGTSLPLEIAAAH